MDIPFVYSAKIPRGGFGVRCRRQVFILSFLKNSQNSRNGSLLILTILIYVMKHVILDGCNSTQNSVLRAMPSSERDFFFVVLYGEKCCPNGYYRHNFYLYEFVV